MVNDVIWLRRTLFFVSPCLWVFIYLFIYLFIYVVNISKKHDMIKLPLGESVYCAFHRHWCQEDFETWQFKSND